MYNPGPQVLFRALCTAQQHSAALVGQMGLPLVVDLHGLDLNGLCGRHGDVQTRVETQAVEEGRVRTGVALDDGPMRTWLIEFTSCVT